MLMARTPTASVSKRERSSAHDGFLRYRNFRWAKIATVISLIAIVSYLLIDVTPRHNGGSAYGYVLGTIGALLILWLTVLQVVRSKGVSH